ncbi:MAG: hypothetical protein ACREGJ_04410 [Candidatus Saccharimonadales bacterium]
MDADQNQHPPMSGDDDLAKALSDSLQYEEMPMPGADIGAGATSGTADATTTPTPPSADDLQLPEPPVPTEEPASPEAPQAGPESDKDEPPTVHHAHATSHKAKDEKDEDEKEKPKETPEAPSLPAPAPLPSTGNKDLDKLKQSALEELRPLVGKLDLPPEDKFDTLLLIIRSTDDQSLLDEAHQAAKNIGDETRRAQALLDIVKEIDYFATKK